MKRMMIPFLILALVPGALAAQEAGGNRAYRKSNYEESLRRYRKALERSEGEPRIHYNLGTALLQLGQDEGAREELVRGLEAQDPELRLRAFYNIGNSLTRSEEDKEPSVERLQQAAEAYKRALLLDPSRVDAKWNLELTLERIEQIENQLQQGGSQNQQQPPPLNAGGGEEPPPPSPGPGGKGQEQRQRPLPEVPPGDLEAPLPRELAEQILRAVEERERDLQRRKMRRRRGRTTGPDW